MTPGGWGVPAQLTPAEVLTTLLIIGAVTVLLRWLPFRAVELLRGAPLIDALRRMMPVGVMAALAVYTLLELPWQPALVGVGATVGAHYMKRQPVLSITVGTLAYMAAASWMRSH